jgi:hypothetical protein
MAEEHDLVPPEYRAHQAARHRAFQSLMRDRFIVPVANDPVFDASVGFEFIEDAIKYATAYMEAADQICNHERHNAATHDIALYSKGRVLAVLRHGAGGVIEVNQFAPQEGSN